MSAGRTIGVDWGTSRFRAYLIGADGSVLEKRENDRGILSVAPGEFPVVLRAAVSDWRRAHPDAPIVASGMVGSRQGWREIPYVFCPSGLREVAAGVGRVECEGLGVVQLVPGVACRDDTGIPDVMRGEETQILGAAAELGEGAHLVVLPGTHSKWAAIRDGSIVAFSTYMTGELFATLRGHSILGRLMAESRADESAFMRGAGMATKAGGGLLRHLFSARTLGLFGELPAPALESYLSGLLIGSEVADAIAAAGGAPTSLALVAGAALAPAYAKVLASHGVSARQIGEEVSVRGLWLIAQQSVEHLR
jgi:2-dehydro-3-deoxygalactonokinase